MATGMLGGTENVAGMCWTLGEKYLGLTVGEIPQPIETPNMGLLHPEYDGYFTSPQDYLNWYKKPRRDVSRNVPTNHRHLVIS